MGLLHLFIAALAATAAFAEAPCACVTPDQTIDPVYSPLLYFQQPTFGGVVNGKSCSMNCTFTANLDDHAGDDSALQVHLLTNNLGDGILNVDGMSDTLVITSDTPTGILYPKSLDTSITIHFTEGTTNNGEFMIVVEKVRGRPDKPVTYELCNCGLSDGWFDDWDPTTIWVDVVIVLDTSQSMTGILEEAKAVVDSFVSLMSTDTSAEFYSKIGVIAAADTPQVIYNLNMSSSDNLDMIHRNTIDKIDITTSLKAAMKMLNDDMRSPSYRENAQKIIYFLTASAAETAISAADHFKVTGGLIIVNNFILNGKVADPGLQNLASEGYFFTDLTEDFLSSLRVFCEANCFCSTNEHAFNDDQINPRTRANRGCFHPVNNMIPLQKARDVCQIQGKYLVSIHDQNKEQFVSGVASVFGAKKKYWIGLQNIGSQWNWDDKSSDKFADWDVNQPDTKNGTNMCAYAQQGSGFNVKWTAASCGTAMIYVCESAPCSVGNKNCFE